MINNQWEKCRICGEDKKFVILDMDKKREFLICKKACERIHVSR